MAWPADLPWQQFLTFSLVLARMSGLVMTAPLVGGREVPVRVRAIFGFALALVIAPTQTALAGSWATGSVGYLLAVVGEVMIGVALGIGLMLLFAGMQVAGQIVSQMSGLSLADVFNPNLDSATPLFGQLFYLFSLAIFVAIGGQRLMIAAMLDTFATLPVGTITLDNQLAETVTTLMTQSLALGVRAAAPTATALLLATLALGLLGRALPQLNLLSFGFGMNVLVTLGAVALSLGAIAWAFEAQLEPFVQQIVAGLQRGQP
ncbi:MAG: flagellar biosynthetic protein FliR [Planctomycetaceae bacterium]|nr:flagellar biosynthetic protein FliR [Planctomycetaceae bacterium]